MERVQNRISVYADDDVMFLRPNTNDLNLMKELLDIFGQVWISDQYIAKRVQMMIG